MARASNKAKVVAASDQDRITSFATRADLDIWPKEDVSIVVDWILQDPCRVPNNRVGAGGGRLFKMVNILNVGCNHAHEVMGRNTGVQLALRSEPATAVHHRYLAPLAKKCLVKVDARQAEKAKVSAKHDSDAESDDDFYD